jgi:hypothetical protein
LVRADESPHAGKRWKESIEFSPVAIDRDRGSEECTRLLMRAHLARGRANAALTADKAYTKAHCKEHDRKPVTVPFRGATGK